MNIFVLDTNPQKAAQYHCDKHVVKMILEYSQLLSTAHRIIDGERKKVIDSGKVKFVYQIPDIRDAFLYKVAHVNHPCSQWTRMDKKNYEWLLALLLFLHDEYESRYGKEHASKKLISFLQFAPSKILEEGMTAFPLCMPDEYKVKDNVVQSYRNYYIGDKKRFAVWKNGKVPEWMK